MNSESSLHYSVQKILADNVSVRGWLVSTNWDQTLRLHGFVLARMTRHPMKCVRQPPFSVYSYFILRLEPFQMASGGPCKALSKDQDRVRTTLVDFALGRTPNSSGVRLTVPRENLVTPAVGFGSLTSG